jgi:hypothetical protein
MGNGALAKGPKLPRPSSTLPSLHFSALYKLSFGTKPEMLRQSALTGRGAIDPHRKSTLAAGTLVGAILIAPVDDDVVPRRPPDFADEGSTGWKGAAPPVNPLAVGVAGLNGTAEPCDSGGHRLASGRIEAVLKLSIIEAAQNYSDRDQRRHLYKL